MRSLAIMRETKAPVVFDATHSVQLPGGQGKSSGAIVVLFPCFLVLLLRLVLMVFSWRPTRSGLRQERWSRMQSPWIVCMIFRVISCVSIVL